MLVDHLMPNRMDHIVHLCARLMTVPVIGSTRPGLLILCVLHSDLAVDRPIVVNGKSIYGHVIQIRWVYKRLTSCAFLVEERLKVGFRSISVDRAATGAGINTLLTNVSSKIIQSQPGERRMVQISFRKHWAVALTLLQAVCSNLLQSVCFNK